MVSDNFILWEVDVQRDFVLPGGKLYVPVEDRFSSYRTETSIRLMIPSSRYSPLTV